MRRRRRIAQGVGRGPGWQRSLAVDRLAERIDHAAEPVPRRPHHRIGADDLRLAAEPDPLEGAEGHEQGLALAKANHLAKDAAAAATLDLAAASDREAALDAAQLDEHAEDRRDAAVKALLGHLAELGENPVLQQERGLAGSGGGPLRPPFRDGAR